MGQRLIGTILLGAGIAGGPLLFLFEAGATTYVVAAVLAASGLVMLRDARSGAHGRERNRRETLQDRIEAAPDSRDLSAAFAVISDADGRLRTLTQEEVDAVFVPIEARWRGLIALGLDDEPDEAPPAGLDDTLVSIRADVLQAESYLGAISFGDPTARFHYAGIVADLEALMRQMGDRTWASRRA